MAVMFHWQSCSRRYRRAAFATRRNGSPAGMALKNAIDQVCTDLARVYS
jgi:hypothetical protein